MTPEPMVPSLDKLLDIVASGLGAVASPTLATWTAKQQAKALQIQTQGIVDSLQIFTAFESTFPELASTILDVRYETGKDKNISQKVHFQSEKRLRNFQSVSVKTAVELGDKCVPDRELDHDWIARFFNYIQDVSPEEMQSLWAKVLAGEIERPGRVSVRSLSILRNLDQHAAMLFKKLCSVCISDLSDDMRILDARVLDLGNSPYKNGLGKFGLSFDDLNLLNEHNLIISNYESSYPMGYCIGKTESNTNGQKLKIHRPFFFQSRHWALVPIMQIPAGNEFRVGGVALSQAGKELCGTIEHESLPKYHSDLERYFASCGLVLTEVGSPDQHTIDIDVI